MSCMNGDEIPVYGQGANIRDWLFVGDHAEALLSISLVGKPGETYNISGENEMRNLDLVNAICDLVDELAPRGDGDSHRSLIRFVPDRLGHDLRYAMRHDKTTREIGWVPTSGFTEALQTTVAWYLHNREWWEDILSGGYQEGIMTASDDLNERGGAL